MTRFPELPTFRTMPIVGLAALMLSIFASPTLATAQNERSENGRRGELHTQKVCPNTTFTGAPGSYCTVTVSDLAEIPANETRIYYDGPTPLPIGATAFADSKIVVYAGLGNWATGRCTVDFTNGLGLCTVSDGTGTLAGFSARLDVRIDFASGITYWDGTYRFKPLPDSDR